MRKILILALAASASAPALAQHQGHAMPTPSKEKAEPAQAAADPHAGHVMPEPAPAPAQPADPHAGHKMPMPAPAAPPAKTADSHAGHGMPPAATPPPADPNAGHDMGAMGEEMPGPPVAPPPPGALSGPAHAADAVYGREAMADARGVLLQEHGSMTSYKVLIDQFEARIRNGRDGYFLNAEAWYGGDISKLWLKTEIEGEAGRGPEQAEVQALYSRAIDPWWNLQAGVRYDVRPDPERAYLVLGIEGLAPYWFEVDAAAFVSNKGDVSARFEAEVDQRLTQKLILQPRVEFDLAVQDVPEIGIGSGLSSAEAGLRLRYQIVPEFAPYVGIAYERAFGDTADFRRAAGDKAGGWNLLLGVRAWF